MSPEEQVEEVNESAAPPDSQQGVLRAVLQTLAGIAVFFGVVLLASVYFRGPLSALGRDFVGRFGVPGLFLGTFAADAFSFPIPPQFYLLTLVTAGGAQALGVAAIASSSFVAGQVAFRMSRFVSRHRVLRSRLAASQGRVDSLFQRYGKTAVLMGCVTPIPYSLFCYAAGIYRMPRRLFLAFTLLRVPRILFYYLLIRVGWR